MAGGVRCEVWSKECEGGSDGGGVRCGGGGGGDSVKGEV